MTREVASRIPAQKAVLNPTGPAPMIVISRTSSRSAASAAGSSVMAP